MNHIIMCIGREVHGQKMDFNKWIFKGCDTEARNYDAHTCNLGKWKNIARMIEEMGDDCQPGDYFWFPDPDFEVLFDPALMFSHMAILNLDVCQPSLTDDSPCSHDFLKRRENTQDYARAVPHIEIGCPAMSYAAVKRNYWTFGLNYSGYGIDLIWGKKEKCYVLDQFQVRHTHPPDYPNAAANAGFPDPLRELEEVRRLYL